uniref:Reverse transcriptase domain-containing protein n=1 Tax=Tanacetum cinerariifolium TaxID=118510 RepID=A0A6L2LRP9_TANCI|nr:reverse transcriptase domain-containing protein [Tanacetum cinerariifolium]
MTNQEADGSGSGIKRTQTYIPRDREEAEQRLLEDYFGNDDTPPKYPEENFRRRVPGSNNDLNVLYGSPLFDDVLADKALKAPFVVNGRTYKQGYYLADDIYPTWSMFVKTFSIARDGKTLKFKRVQESARKDIERAFGVLQGRLGYYTTTGTVNIQELCEEYYEDILPIIMDKVHRDRRKYVHTRLDFGDGPRERTREDSHHSSARARTTKPERLKVQDHLRYGDRHVLDRLGHRRQSAFDRLSETYSPSTTKSRPRGTDFMDHPRGRSRPHRLDTSNEDRPKDRERFRSVGESYDDSFSHSYRDGNRSRHMKRRRDNESPLSSVSKSDSSDWRYWRSRSKRHKSTDEDDLTRPWMCEEEDPTRMPNNVKTYDGTGDPEDHVKIFKVAAQVEIWAMPTWCHMFNSTLIGAAKVWFNELPPESIDSYKDLKAAFLTYFMQQKKYVKDPVKIHNIKQKDGETIEDFMERFKVEIGRTMEEMMITTTAFVRGEAVVASKKKGQTSWKAHDQSKRQNSDKRSDFRGHSREGRGSNRFTPLTRTPNNFLAAEAGKFQPPPPMVTPVEKRSSIKFCDFYNDKGHSTDECMQLKKQTEELVRAGKLSRLIKEIKHGRDQSKTGKKETTAKDKPTTIYMIQSWQRTTRPKVTQSFERVKEITFPPLAASSGTKGPLVIETEMGGHMIHRMYEDGGSSMKILYEHCFNRLRPEIKSQMVPATTSLTGFSGETIWPLGQIRLLVIIGDANHSTRVWINFMIVRSLSPYNGTIGRPRIREIQAVPFTVHGMLKFPEVAIGGTLSDKGRNELCSILKKNLDIFAWKPSDMTGVPRGPKTGGGRDHERGLLPRLVVQSNHVGRNKEVYVDDLVVKSYTETEMLRDIEETFRTLRKINMKLNPKKCVFRLAEGVFLGYVFTPDRIKPCPDKTTAVLQLPSPRTIKEAKNVGQWTDLSGFSHRDAERKPTSRASSRNSTRAVDTFHGRLIMCGRVRCVAYTDKPGGNRVYLRAEISVAASNNEAEYEALIASLRIAAQMGVKNVHVSVDSKLVANQVLETYVAKEDNMVKYMDKVKSLVRGFTNFSISQVPGSKNKKADALSKIASTSFAHLSKHVLVEVLKDKSIKEKERDACDMIQKCNDCQIHRLITRSPQQPLTPVKAPWPFYNWGIDIAGPFPEGPGKVKFFIVAMDYFTKWIEAKAVATITGDQVKKFVWDNIVCRFGLPGEIVSDNGKQFNDNPFKDWCDNLNITQRFASVKHLQSNGHVERANRSLGEGIKARLDVVSNDEELRLNLDLLEERRERAAICEAKAKSKMTKYYNARVRGVTFRPGDFVYRSNDASHAVAGGKLGPKWEGPYEVTEALGDEAYKLRSIDGTILLRTWNIANRKRCYL